MPAATRRALEEHAHAEAPNEACGLVLLEDGVAVEYRPGRNALASPYRFQLEPGDAADFFAEDEGYELAVFHSHPETEARPSRTDIANIGLWEGRPYLILSLARGELRAWRIEAGVASELDMSLQDA
ncbi:MAG TPA: M67 family metallopeptidase [Gaiellaceae bacterium]|nr:M67 family metallopeptidase [Gaiellaceae bacterium]